MSKTVHPYSFRLGILRNWKSRWFNVKNYRKLLKADILVKEWLREKMRGMYVERIEIERGPSSLNIIVRTSRPGLIIGRKGGGSESLKKEIMEKLRDIKADIPREFKLTIEEISSPESRAQIMAQIVAESLEKRMSFRRVMKQTLEKVMSNKDVKGAKIALAGRLDGSEMSRREWLKRGRVPLQTLRADIDFAKERARLPYGDIGIKVWIYRGEKF
jgi:small subunit ribosomal protein S3